NLSMIYEFVAKLIKLHELSNPCFFFSRQQVHYRDLDQGISSRLLFHGCTGCTHKNLCRESRIIDAHIETEQLVLCISGNTFAFHQHTVSHVFECLYIFHLENMGLIMDEIIIGLDSLSYGWEVESILQFNIYHPAMDACAGR